MTAKRSAIEALSRLGLFVALILPLTPPLAIAQKGQEHTEENTEVEAKKDPSLQRAETNTSRFDRQTKWKGFDQFHFQVAGRKAYLVVPTTPLAGRPWIWRARFPGYHDEMDVELVGRGFHLAYLDVSNEFGSPTAIRDAQQFYDRLITRHRLSRGVVMEGVSRGGLFVYNWATQHPESVAGIYCDTPVLDFVSWPGGKGVGLGSASAWKACLNAYEMSETQATQYGGQPVDQAVLIANAQIPILHIVSENDCVVPPSENTYRLRDALRDEGHDLDVISVKAGTAKSNGHHFDHPDPERVVEFVLRCVDASDSKSKDGSFP